MNVAMMVFQFVVLIFSAILHEIAHGYEAERLGDDTARRAGRLTLNPIVHLDLFGSILMPALLYMASGGAFFFGAAKPVPYDPRNLKDPRSGGAKIALAGPLTNFSLAVVFGLLVRAAAAVPFPVPDVIGIVFAVICLINLILAVFNLVPIPPLDGSRILFALLPPSESVYRAMYALERWGLLLVIVFVMFGFQFITPVIGMLFTLLTGQSV